MHTRFAALILENLWKHEVAEWAVRKVFHMHSSHACTKRAQTERTVVNRITQLFRGILGDHTAELREQEEIRH